MKFSIVTAVFNREKSIAQAMACLQRQSYGCFEHIVVDGKSTDNTLAIVKEIADARTTVISEPDSGIYDAINKGIAASKGDVIGLLHSDDCFADEQVLERIAKKFSENRYDIVYGDLEYVRDDAKESVVRRWKAGDFRRSQLKMGWMPPHPTVFIKRSVIEKHGNYDASYRIAADYDALLRYFTDPSLKFGYIPKVLVKMRVGGASNGSFKKMMAKSWEDYKSLRRHRVGGLFTLGMKNISKITQFSIR